VKRVVTVKQVRPSSPAALRRAEVGPGHGYALPMREHRRWREGRCASSGGAVFAHRLQDAMIGGPLLDVAAKGPTLGSGSEPSDICPLSSVLCSLHAASPRAWGWARARHDKGIW
jgi:hypothetical protein